MLRALTWSPSPLTLSTPLLSTEKDKAMAKYGDYVGNIFNDLKGGREGPPFLQKTAIAIANEIDLAEKRRATSNPPKFDIINLLERQAGLA